MYENCCIRIEPKVNIDFLYSEALFGKLCNSNQLKILLTQIHNMKSTTHLAAFGDFFNCAYFISITRGRWTAMLALIKVDEIRAV